MASYSNRIRNASCNWSLLIHSLLCLKVTNVCFVWFLFPWIFVVLQTCIGIPWAFGFLKIIADEYKEKKLVPSRNNYSVLQAFSKFCQTLSTMLEVYLNAIFKFHFMLKGDLSEMVQLRRIICTWAFQPSLQELCLKSWRKGRSRVLSKKMYFL